MRNRVRSVASPIVAPTEPSGPGDDQPGPTKDSGGTHDSARSQPVAWRQTSLQILVFTAGAVLMGLEIAGSRVLAPHFGTSVFVWGSLISVFLIALSVGYYLGGLIADRFPSRVLLNSICIAVALLLLGVALFSHDVSAQLVAMGLGEQSGPFVASLILFLPPSIGMGIVSPFAIRLATSSVGSVGRSSGKLYALSTVGSIAGTLLTTFVFIPQFGLTSILMGLSFTLLLVAVLTMPFRHGIDVVTALVVLTASTIIYGVQDQPNRIAKQPGDAVLLDVDTPYHHVTVVGRGQYRELRFDRYVETVIQTEPPYRSLAGYTDYFHLAFLLKPQIQSALFIGAGGGVGPRTFAKHAPSMQIDVVDIDPAILQVAQDYFFLTPTDNVRLVAQDGRMFVRQSQQKYDCLVLDAFTIGGRIPPHLVTREFLLLCRDRMSEDGVFLMNINSAIQGESAAIFLSMYKTLADVFPQAHAFVQGSQQQRPDQSTNVILVGSKQVSGMTAEQWSESANNYHSQSYVDSARMRELVRDLLVENPVVSSVPMFTDDFAPIETMSF